MYLYEFFPFSVFKKFPSFCALLNHVLSTYINSRPDRLFHNLIVPQQMEVYFHLFLQNSILFFVPVSVLRVAKCLK